MLNRREYATRDLALISRTVHKTALESPLLAPSERGDFHLNSTRSQRELSRHGVGAASGDPTASFVLCSGSRETIQRLGGASKFGETETRLMSSWSALAIHME